MTKSQVKTIPVSVDVAVFRLASGELEVLLAKRAEIEGEPFPGAWVLPGGTIDPDTDDDEDAAAHRTLARRTTAVVPYLEQVRSRGSRTRDPRRWTMTVLYYALVGPSFGFTLKPGDDVQELAWTPVSSSRLRALGFDHTQLFKLAHERLKAKMAYSLLPAYLLPKGFTLSELQAVYEQILGVTLDKSAFRKKLDELNGLEETGEMRTGPNRPAKIYRIKRSKVPLLFPKNLA